MVAARKVPLLILCHSDAVRKEIEDETARITGPGRNVSPVPIHLSIYSPNGKLQQSGPLYNLFHLIWVPMNSQVLVSQQTPGHGPPQAFLDTRCSPSFDF
jgi:hypothetical protein